LLSFGFQKTADGYRYEADFFDGNFHAILWVDEQGKITGKVMDKMNEEEYAALRNESFTGGYVNAVRTAYEALLNTIAQACCEEVLFASDQATAKIWQQFQVQPDFPWGETPYQRYGTFRHADNQKWFALIMNVKWNVLLKNQNTDTVDIVNLKINPDDGDRLRAKEGIFPAYHMNRKHWITVLLNDTLSDDEVMALIRTSFELTRKK
jgi:predicted DNA-binding protein (MmcQ/YjbR family)